MADHRHWPSVSVGYRSGCTDPFRANSALRGLDSEAIRGDRLYVRATVGNFDRALSRIGIEPPERAFCAWARLSLALLSAAAYALFNASETLFLKRVGIAYLPWVLLASSGLLVMTTGLTSRALAMADRPRALPRVLLGLAALLLAFWAPLQRWHTPAVFGAFVLVARQLLALGVAPLIAWVAVPVALLWLASALVLWRAYPRLLLQASGERGLGRRPAAGDPANELGTGSRCLAINGLRAGYTRRRNLL
jgi:hypothetical protein